MVDRETGAVGVVTERFDVAKDGRRLVGEALYAVPALDGAVELSGFGRAELRSVPTDAARYTVGAHARIRF